MPKHVFTTDLFFHEDALVLRVVPEPFILGRCALRWFDDAAIAAAELIKGLGPTWLWTSPTEIRRGGWRRSLFVPMGFGECFSQALLISGLRFQKSE